MQIKNNIIYFEDISILPHNIVSIRVEEDYCFKNFEYKEDIYAVQWVKGELEFRDINTGYVLNNNTYPLKTELYNEISDPFFEAYLDIKGEINVKIIPTVGKEIKGSLYFDITCKYEDINNSLDELKDKTLCEYSDLIFGAMHKMYI
jgi:hypothetical protein